MNSSLRAVEDMILLGRAEIYAQDISRWKCLLHSLFACQVSLNSSLLIPYRHIKCKLKSSAQLMETYRKTSDCMMAL